MQGFGGEILGKQLTVRPRRRWEDNSKLYLQEGGGGSELLYSDLLRAGRSGEIESRWGVRFSAPVQTGPGTHPASYTFGTGSLS